MTDPNKNRPGYKKTKVGWIPEEWACARLNTVATVVRGGSPRPARSPLYFNGDFIPWITVAEITNSSGAYLYETATCLTEAGSNFSRIFPEGSLLLANSGATLGVPKITLVRACANDGVAGFLNLSESTSNLFLYYFLSSKTRFLRDCLAPGVGQPNLNTKLIGSLRAPLPSFLEQEAIAGVLECWDRGLEKLELKIVKKRNIKKGLMQALLSGKIRLPGFGTTENTEGHGKGRDTIPVGWKEVRLGASGSFSKGKGIAKDDVAETGFPCIRYGQIYTTDAHTATWLPSRISPELAQHSTRIGYNDLLLTGSGETIDEIGKSLAYMGIDKAYAGGDIVIFSAQAGMVRADYLAYYLNTEGRRSVRRLGQGQSVVHAYARDLVNVVAPLPSVKEQQAIVAVISDADTEVETLERKLAVLKEQKRFLLNNLVTGTIRLPEFCNHGTHGIAPK